MIKTKYDLKKFQRAIADFERAKEIMLKTAIESSAAATRFAKVFFKMWKKEISKSNIQKWLSR